MFEIRVGWAGVAEFGEGVAGTAAAVEGERIAAAAAGVGLAAAAVVAEGEEAGRAWAA